MVQLLPSLRVLKQLATVVQSSNAREWLNSDKIEPASKITNILVKFQLATPLNMTIYIRIVLLITAWPDDPKVLIAVMLTV